MVVLYEIRLAKENPDLDIYYVEEGGRSIRIYLVYEPEW